MPPTRNQLKKQADLAHRNMKKCLGFPEELVFTELYYQEMQNAKDGLDLRVEKARITEDSLKCSFQEHMPKGYVYGEDGRLYILQPTDSLPESAEEAEEKQSDDLSKFPAEFPSFAEQDMMTSTQANCLIFFFFAWITTYWLGWRPFILSTSITSLMFWLFVRFIRFDDI